jgi:hypothetical protein
MRERDPRGIVRRRREAAARVNIVGKPQNSSGEDGSVTSKQVADIYLPESELDRIWSVEYLERLALSHAHLTGADPGEVHAGVARDRAADAAVQAAYLQGARVRD